MGHPNEDLFRGGYDAFSTGDLDALREKYFTPDIVWHSPGDNPLSGDFKGVDEVIASFGKTFELSGGTFKTEVHDCLANDDHGVVLGTIRAQREGKTLESTYTHIVHFRDGKVAESWIQSGDQRLVDDFWS
jgi:ketosteroid isomerase-like protein